MRILLHRQLRSANAPSQSPPECWVSSWVSGKEKRKSQTHENLTGDDGKDLVEDGGFRIQYRELPRRNGCTELLGIGWTVPRMADPTIYSDDIPCSGKVEDVYDIEGSCLFRCSTSLGGSVLVQIGIRPGGYEDFRTIRAKSVQVRLVEARNAPLTISTARPEQLPINRASRTLNLSIMRGVPNVVDLVLGLRPHPPVRY